MREIDSNETFLEKLKNKNKFYNQSFKVLDTYKGMEINLTVENKYGKGYMTPIKMFGGSDFGIRSSINPTEYWINQAKEIYGNKYDYTQVKYTRFDCVCTIKCNEHIIEFEQGLEKHLKGSEGCPKCLTTKMKKPKKNNYFIQTHEDFINHLSNHNEDYKNGKFIVIGKFINSYSEIAIKLGKEITYKRVSGLIEGKTPITLDIDIKKQNILNILNEKYKNNFEYKPFIYKNLEQEIDITCKKHNHSFKSLIKNHKSHNGCSYCKSENKKNKHSASNAIGWSWSKWEQVGSKSKNFESFKCYIIKCWNDDRTEEFYKIGKTFVTIKSRFEGVKKMPYNYEVVETYIGLAQYISKLEDILKKLNKEHKYIPKIKFGGMTECFSQIEFK